VPASTPASGVGMHTPARQERPEAHCAVRVQGSSSRFVLMFVPQANRSRQNSSQQSRPVIEATIAQPAIGHHALQHKRC